MHYVDVEEEGRELREGRRVFGCGYVVCTHVGSKVRRISLAEERMREDGLIYRLRSRRERN